VLAQDFCYALAQLRQDGVDAFEGLAVNDNLQQQQQQQSTHLLYLLVAVPSYRL
jgi:hypothetical protein